MNDNDSPRRHEARCGTGIVLFDSAFIRVPYTALLIGIWTSSLAIILYEIWLYFPTHTIDFAQHYFLGRWVNQGGAVTDARWPYETGVQWVDWMYTVIPYLPYQPLLLPVMRLLASLPYSVAASVWLGGAMVTWWALSRPLATSLGWSARCTRLALASFPFLWLGLYFGNVDIYLAPLTLGAVLLLQKERPLWSGFLWGWIGAFKPSLLFGAVPGLRSNARPFLAGLVLGGLNALGAAYLAVGMEGLLFFARHFREFSRETFWQLLPVNASLAAWLAAWVGPDTPSSRSLLGLQWPVLPLAFLAGALFLFLTFWVWRRLRSTRSTLWIEAGLWLSTGFIVVPVTWFQYFLYLLAPMLYTGSIISQRADKCVRFLWSAFLVFLVAPWGKLLFPTQPFRTQALVMGTMYMWAWFFFLYAARRLQEEEPGEHDVVETLLHPPPTRLP